MPPFTRARRLAIGLAATVALLVTSTPVHAAEIEARWEKGKPIYIVDNTTSDHLVRPAIWLYDRYPDTRLRLVARCPNPDGTGCIMIVNGDLPGDLIGYADGLIWLYPQPLYKSVTITLQPDPLSRRDRLFLMCHELGHALGLKHRTGQTSCMTTTPRPPAPIRPDAADRALLDSWYR